MLSYQFNLVQFFYTLTVQGTRPTISLFADSLGASSIVVGLLVSLFALFPMVTAVQAGKWLDRYGARKLSTLGGLGMFLSLSIPMVFPRLSALFISQLLIGVSHLLVIISLQKTIGNLPGNRDKHIASLSLVGSIGGMIGPLLSGFSYEYFGFRMTFACSSIIVALALMISWWLDRNAWENTAEKMEMPRHVKSNSTWGLLLVANLRNALLIGGLVLYSKDLFGAYFPIYASKLGFTPSKIGLLLSVMSGMAVLVRVGQFYLVGRFGREKVLFWSLIASGLAFICVPLTGNLFWLSLLTMVLGACLGLGQPLSLVYAMNISPPGRQGEVLGIRLTFNRGAQFFAPFLFGAIGGGLGLPPIFYISGMILLIGARLALTKGSVNAELRK